MPMAIGKKQKIGRDDRLGQQAVQPDGAKHHDEDRRECQDRPICEQMIQGSRLPLQHAAVHDQERQHDAEEGASPKPSRVADSVTSE